MRPSNAMEWAGGAQAFSVKRGCYLWRDPQPSECPACSQGAGRFVLTDPDEPWNGSDHLLFFHCFEHVLAYMPACPTLSSHPERLVLALALAFRVAGISQPGAEVGILEPGRTYINNPPSVARAKEVIGQAYEEEGPEWLGLALFLDGGADKLAELLQEPRGGQEVAVRGERSARLNLVKQVLGKLAELQEFFDELRAELEGEPTQAGGLDGAPVIEKAEPAIQALFERLGDP